MAAYSMGRGFSTVIPASLQDQVLDLLHLRHFGMQRMKQLARSAAYRLRIDQNIERIKGQWAACAEFQNWPTKPTINSRCYKKNLGADYP